MKHITRFIRHMCLVKSSVKIHYVRPVSWLWTFVCNFRDFSSVAFILITLFTHMIPRPTKCFNVNWIKLVGRVVIAAFCEQETNNAKSAIIYTSAQHIVLLAWWSLPWRYLNVKYFSRSVLDTHITKHLCSIESLFLQSFKTYDFC